MSYRYGQNLKTGFVTLACKGKSTTMSDYAQTAAARWPGKVIHGNDRFAVVHGDEVWLFDTMAQARAVRLGWDDASVLDLEPPFVPDLPDDWEDKRWERRR